MDFGGIFNVKYDSMDTIGVSYEMIIDHVIRFDTRKFPNTEFTSLSKIALKIKAEIKKIVILYGLYKNITYFMYLWHTTLFTI